MENGRESVSTIATPEDGAEQTSDFDFSQYRKPEQPTPEDGAEQTSDFDFSQYREQPKHVPYESRFGLDTGGPTLAESKGADGPSPFDLEPESIEVGGTPQTQKKIARRVLEMLRKR